MPSISTIKSKGIKFTVLPMQQNEVKEHLAESQCEDEANAIAYLAEELGERSVSGTIK